MHRFFRWAVNAEYLEKDPSRLIKRGKVDHNQTQPLTGMDQFNQVLQATYKLDEVRYTLGPVPEYGRDLRTIFELERWTGIRLIDAVMFRRSALKDGRMTLKTKKTGAWIIDRKLPQRVVDALAEIPEDQEHVRLAVTSGPSDAKMPTTSRSSQFLASLDTTHVICLRDRAILAVLVYSSSRAGPVAKLRCGDFYNAGQQWMLHFN